MKTVMIIQARMGSSRLPGKVLKTIGRWPAISWVALSAHYTYGVDDVWLATSTNPEDDELAAWAHDIKFMSCFRGSELDVLDRYYQTAVRANADVIIRVTGDCPLLDPNVTAEVIALQKQTGYPYVSNVDPATYPDGLDVQVMTMDALQLTWKEATRPSDRECVCEYMTRDKNRFPSANLTCPVPGLADERWVLDTFDDLEFLRLVTDGFQPGISYPEVLDILHRKPQLRDINKKWTRNERFFESIEKETP
jgi:glutamate-1-semialdehyde 2,1-aminomutase